MNHLLQLEKDLSQELEAINYPQQNWIVHSDNPHDVVIIGAGMAGLAVSFALKRLGINNIKIYDRNPMGYEGPWATYARMPTLRSTKELVGPALDIPSLTFRSWYEAQYGSEGWRLLGKIPTSQWMEYLRWFRKVLDLPIENNKPLHAIVPEKEGLALRMDQQKIMASKIILATGRGGYGGSYIPLFVKQLPSNMYAHTNDPIDFKALRHKKVAIIGAGASGFDAATIALEQGAFSVDIIVRRPYLPYINKAASLTYSGFTEGYYHLSDEDRWKMMLLCQEGGAPPPVEALDRLKSNLQFAVKLGVCIEEAEGKNSVIYLKTNKGIFQYDFLILATGFSIEGSKQPELAPLIDKILLWKDRKEIQNLKGPENFYQSPYLGPHFQFLEKEVGTATYLKNIYCFNYGATLSHGLLSGDIPGIGCGALRLARGIASDFFTHYSEQYRTYLNDYENPEFEKSNYTFFQPDNL